MRLGSERRIFKYVYTNNTLYAEKHKPTNDSMAAVSQNDPGVSDAETQQRRTFLHVTNIPCAAMPSAAIHNNPTPMSAPQVAIRQLTNFDARARSEPLVSSCDFMRNSRFFLRLPEVAVLLGHFVKLPNIGFGRAV